MIRIAERLWLGGQSDWERTVRIARGPWHVIHACKEPYRRLFVGYQGRGCPKDNPEYLWAVRGRRIALNLVDGQEPEWVPEVAVDFAIERIAEWTADYPVLLHCNRGESRSAVIGMLWLASQGRFLGMDFEAAEAEFRRIYPPYNPRGGMRLFAMQKWEKYAK